MSVGVQREACRKMPQHTRHGLDVHTVLQSQRCEGVAQVMEPHLRQPCPLQDAVQHMQHAVRRYGASGGRWEYPFTVPNFAFLYFQNVYRVCRQRQGAVGVFCFQRHLVSVKCSGGLKVTRENERIPPYRT